LELVVLAACRNVQTEERVLVIQRAVLKVYQVPRRELVAVHSLAGCLVMAGEMPRMASLAVRELAMWEYPAALDTPAEVSWDKG
jgi:hypothetical protein